jgi:hypothetical protein
MNSWPACNFFKGRLPQRSDGGGGGNWRLGTNSPQLRTGYKTLRHTVGGGEQ